MGYLSLDSRRPRFRAVRRDQVGATLGRRLPKDPIVLDEPPSTGLHPQDLTGLLVVLSIASATAQPSWWWSTMPPDPPPIGRDRSRPRRWPDGGG
ncbi:MAG: hypothetical protein R2873_26005 [Caldilineaceae bacterium]